MAHALVRAALTLVSALRVFAVAALLTAALCPGQEIKPSDHQAVEAGRLNFRILCAPCHGIRAEGGRGPDLTRGSYSAGDQDKDLYRVISSGVAGTEMAAYAGRLDNDDIWRLVAYIRSVAHSSSTKVPGNIAAGEMIFWSKGGCSQCHRVGAKGSSLGPDLTRIGRLRSIEYLRTSVLKPDADITPGYATVTVATKEGKKIVGVERNFDNFSAQLVDLSGAYYSFLREDVSSMTLETRSLMPSTYAKEFSATEIDDLLAYMNSLRGNQ